MTTWWQKLHPSERAERALEVILERTGVGAQIEAELEAERAARFRVAAERKGAEIERFVREKSHCEAVVARAEERQRAAQKAAEEALQQYITAREALSTCLGTHTQELEKLHADMLASYNPRIDEFGREIERLLADAPQLYRAWPDPKGELHALGGARASDNRHALERYTRRLIELRDAARDLRTRHDVADLEAEFARLMATLPST